MNLLRKTQCHSGWDWGINLVVCGIYDSIKIERIQDARLGQVSTTQLWGESGSIVLEVEVEFECAERTDLLVSFAETEHRLSLVGSDRVKVNFEVKEPELWWPAAMVSSFIYS